VVPVDRKNLHLAEEAAIGITSLVQQGGIVLAAFVAMLVLTGGTPSGIDIGLTVGLSGFWVAWSEQRRLLHQREDSRHSIGSPDWLKQLELKDISANKLAVLRKICVEIPSNRDSNEEFQKRLAMILNSSDDFQGLVALANLNLLTDFTYADLRGTDLHGLNLSRANLIGANLSGADLHWAKLGKANLSGANLSGAHLGGAELMEADLTKADLSGVNLCCADLRRADLSDANLSNANMGGTEIDGTTVEKTRFWGSQGLSDELKQDLQNRGAIFEDVPAIEVN
jgi:uncharacterized protein YjbI with pentapeptide repeats